MSGFIFLPLDLAYFFSPRLTKPVIVCVWPVWVLDEN